LLSIRQLIAVCSSLISVAVDVEGNDPGQGEDLCGSSKHVEKGIAVHRPDH
jgi:hypothetical protein